MAKSLSERIAQRVSTRQPSRAGKNRASFLAVRDDVKKSLDDGWPVKVIWDTLRDEGKIEFGYDAFIGYVNRLIRDLKSVPPPANQVQTDKPAPNGKTTIKAPQKTKEASPIGGFNFNPTPNKEDLF